MRYFERQPLDADKQAQLDKKQAEMNKQALFYENKTPSFNLSKKLQSEIRKKLMASQKSLCCYCECRIAVKDTETADKGYHFEHFEEQHDVPTAVYIYENMLLSCEGSKNPTAKDETPSQAGDRKSNISCGHGKEKGRHGNIDIDYPLLLNPTVKGVADLLSYIDGVVDTSKICTEQTQVQSVEYTIKRLNLNANRLRVAREKAIIRINRGLYGLTDEEQQAFIQGLLDETQTQLEPYFSTIKDNFGFMLL